jgi:hypothetical protein
MTDILKREGDLTKLPTDEQMRKTTKELLPKQMAVDSSSARVKMSDLVEHTVHRFLLTFRPGVGLRSLAFGVEYNPPPTSGSSFGDKIISQAKN